MIAVISCGSLWFRILADRVGDLFRKESQKSGREMKLPFCVQSVWGFTPSRGKDPTRFLSKPIEQRTGIFISLEYQ